MFTILNKQIIAPSVKRLDIQAETIARRVQPGQFVMVIPRENGEWIPLTVVEADSRRGTIALIVSEVGPAPQQLGAIAIKETIYSILGPLGQPSATSKRFGVVICAATGIGVAQLLPICRNLSKFGNKVICVMGAKTRRDLILEAQMRLACYKIHIVTGDSTDKSSGKSEAGMVKQCLEQPPVDLVYAIGGVTMVQPIAEATKKKKIPFLVQVNPVMCCGLGFCGSCRVKVHNHTVLACEQGPEFDGHKLDFADLKSRLSAYDNDGGALSTPKPSALDGRGTLTKFFTDILKS